MCCGLGVRLWPCVRRDADRMRCDPVDDRSLDLRCPLSEWRSKGFLVL